MFFRERTPLEEFIHPPSRQYGPEFWKRVAQVAAAGAVVSGTVCLVRYLNRKKPGWYRLRRRQRHPPPVVGGPKSHGDGRRAESGPVVRKSDYAKVAKLAVYPIKSCREMMVEEFHCGEMGPEVRTPFGTVRDRSWIITIGDKYHFLSQRRKPRMALIQPGIDGAFLVVNAPGMEPLRVPIQPDISQAKVVTSDVWDHEISAVDCGEEAAVWFSTFLEEPSLRMIFHPSEFGGRGMLEMTQKILKLDRELWETKDKCIFADGAPYLLLSQESVDELSRHTETPVPWIHFRPNILVQGCPPNNEDYWWRFQIGAAEFRNAVQCCRCVETTVDPQTGTFARKDVLEKLKGYRTNQSAELDDIYNSGPVFAVNLGVDRTGKISIGDPVLHLPDA